jgi:hypothetical protein
MRNTATMMKSITYPKVNVAQTDDEDLAPYASLFLKPFATNKSLFTRKELEVMCKDPLHSPRLIMYLIEMVRDL